MKPHQSPQVRLATVLVDRELSTDGVGGLPQVYMRMFAQLAPLLGSRGVHAIFVRSVELARAEALLLSSFAVGDETADAASSLAVCLRDAPMESARNDAITLYSKFFGLIVTFVGAALTAQILRAAWPDVDVDLKEEQ